MDIWENRNAIILNFTNQWLPEMAALSVSFVCSLHRTAIETKRDVIHVP